MLRNGYMVTLYLVGLVLIAVVVPGTDILAQDFGACTGDVMKFCQGVKPGQGDVAKCLIQNKQDLYPGCQSLITVLTEQVKEADEACQEDIMFYCSGVEPGGGRIKRCLKDHESLLSFNCKVKMGMVGFENPK